MIPFFALFCFKEKVHVWSKRTIQQGKHQAVVTTPGEQHYEGFSTAALPTVVSQVVTARGTFITDIIFIL